ncbi:MAG: DUF4317 domain-containing protein [Clostridia bacterium]|nr:DUF4317 domain-containing protein [Clostridia bacterium]
MTENEIAEIRKRIKYDKNNMTVLKGCYVSTKKEIMTEFSQTVGLLSLEENETLFKILKKTLSGRPGRNLMDICFTTEQVADSEEHKLLMRLRDSELEDEEALHTLYQKIIDSFPTADTFMIFVGCDKYDVPNKSKNDEEMPDDSDEVFRYILCSVCPVKLTRSGLGFSTADQEFHNVGADMAISAPEIGFMFPAFDDRSTNIYNALFYTKSPGDDYKAAAEALFCTEYPMPAQEQKENFRTLIAETAADDCSYEFVQSVHEHISDMIDEHKTTKQEEPLLLGKKDVKRVLEDCGASDENIASFDEKFDAAFGEKAEISPLNVIDPKQFEVKTPDVTIKVSPEKSYLLETRVIEGTRYVLIRAEEGVEVNGVGIKIDSPESAQETVSE